MSEGLTRIVLNKFVQLSGYTLAALDVGIAPAQPVGDWRPLVGVSDDPQIHTKSGGRPTNAVYQESVENTKGSDALIRSGNSINVEEARAAPVAQTPGKKLRLYSDLQQAQRNTDADVVNSFCVPLQPLDTRVKEEAVDPVAYFNEDDNSCDADEYFGEGGAGDGFFDGGEAEEGFSEGALVMLDINNVGALDDIAFTGTRSAAQKQPPGRPKSANASVRASRLAYSRPQQTKTSTTMNSQKRKSLYGTADLTVIGTKVSGAMIRFTDTCCFALENAGLLQRWGRRVVIRAREWHSVRHACSVRVQHSVRLFLSKCRKYHLKRNMSALLIQTETRRYLACCLRIFLFRSRAALIMQTGWRRFSAQQLACRIRKTLSARRIWKYYLRCLDVRKRKAGFKIVW
jgi:hypothetical protein